MSYIAARSDMFVGPTVVNNLVSFKCNYFVL